MIYKRIIPSLLLSNGGLVKTTNFKNPKYVGDPINAIRIFNEKEVDELLVLDIDASRKKKPPNYSLIEEFASECFMPLAYGGGISSCEQASKLFQIGVEKIVIQTAIFKNSNLLKELVCEFGSQSIVASVDIITNFWGNTVLYSYVKKNKLKMPWLQFAEKSVKAGVGEILLNSVDKDGTMQGMDLNSIKTACSNLEVPIVAVGGVGSLSDIKEAFKVGASAVSAGSFFVFNGPHKAVLITYPSPEDVNEILNF